MILTIHDFPIKIEENYLKNCRGEIIIDLNKSTKEELLQFISENIPSINDGKRVYKKRLTRTLSSYTIEDAVDIIKTEMFDKGYILSSPKESYEIEYLIISKYGKSKICFNKICLNMEDKKEEIREHLHKVLVKIIDAKEEKNVNEENKEIAIKDLIKFLNLYYNNVIKDKNATLNGLFNKHQEIWFYALNKIEKEIKYPLINVTSGLWRCYIITLFGSKGEVDLLKELTGWTPQMLERERMTYDMKLILLSVNEILKNNN